MPAAYTIAQISPEQIELTYPLVRNVDQSLGQADWSQICETVIRRPANLAGADQIIIATNQTGYVRGVCMFRTSDHPQYGQLLDVSLFAAVSAGDAAGVSEAMLNHLKLMARNQKCRMIRVWRLGTDNWSRTLQKWEFDRWDHGLMIPIDVNGCDI